MTITVIGHGYVGLVTATVFADFGNQVFVIGRTPEKIAKLQQGNPLIFEPGLEELLQKNLQANRINFTTNYNSIKKSDVVFIAVGTPSKADGNADLSQVFSVAKKLSPHLKKGYTVIACKSTVPVGTNKKIKKNIEEIKNNQANFNVVSCPEFLREGTGINDTINPDRVVIGSESKKATQIMLNLHQPISGERVTTDLASAELIKYASNSILATKISFANLISFYCQKTNADIGQVLAAVGLDNRIGPKFLNPGIGYGGACFPKDVKALIAKGKQLGVDSSLLKEVEKINITAKTNFIDQIINNIQGKKIAIWGLSFKPNTNDIREAPSIYILEKLLEKKFKITVYDPAAMDLIKQKFTQKISYANNPYSAATNTDAICILTEWNEFQQIDLEKLGAIMNKKVIFDGRNIYDPKQMRSLGFNYFSIGRKAITQ